MNKQRQANGERVILWVLVVGIWLGVGGAVIGLLIGFLGILYALLF